MARSKFKNDKVLVIGIGNEFQEDEAFGVKVVGMLKSKHPDLAEFIIKPDLGRLVEQFNNRDVIVVDAIKTEYETTGMIYEVDSVQGFTSNKEIMSSTHGLGLSETLKLASILNKSPRSFYFIGVEGGSWSMEEVMSLELEKQIPTVVSKIEAHLSIVTSL